MVKRIQLRQTGRVSQQHAAVLLEINSEVSQDSGPLSEEQSVIVYFQCI